jgi:hypothetical protein
MIGNTRNARQWKIAGIPEYFMERYSYGQCMFLAMALNRRFDWPIKAVFSEGTSGYLRHAWIEHPCGKSLDIAGWDGHRDFLVPGSTIQHVGGWEMLAARLGISVGDDRLSDAEAVMDAYIIPGYLTPSA